MKDNRIALSDIYMLLAKIVSLRSTCYREGNGAVIASNDLFHIYSFGYNGSPKGLQHDCKGISNIGTCGCIHAEINAILKVPVKDYQKIMFCTKSPCMQCADFIIQSGFSIVYYLREYRDISPIKKIRSSGIDIIQYSFSQYMSDTWNMKLINFLYPETLPISSDEN